jgi:hypothetical protein
MRSRWPPGGDLKAELPSSAASLMRERLRVAYLASLSLIFPVRSRALRPGHPMPQWMNSRYLDVWLVA